MALYVSSPDVMSCDRCELLYPILIEGGRCVHIQLKVCTHSIDGGRCVHIETLGIHYI